MSGERRQGEASAVTLRPAGPDDEPFLYQLYCSTRAEEMAAWGWDPAQQEMFLKMQFRARQLGYQGQSTNADSRIIERGDRPIGRLLVFRSESEICLADIALLPEFRGAGIGTALINELLAEAREAGKPVTLHVEKTNPAGRLYQRLGFSVVEDTGVYFKMECREAIRSHAS
jgi:ribosomal protein S18 acetylase RimI-like enzyme